MNLTPIHVAKVCHEVNRVYCEELGDGSQLQWHQAPKWQQESSLNGVAFLIRNPEADHKASHENWMKLKLEQGWKYGEVKDEKKKTHPCLVSFEKLPKEQQFKDKLFHTIVRSLERY